MTDTMPEPPDRALVGLFDPEGAATPIVFERDDTDDPEYDEKDHWFALDEDGPAAYRWEDVVSLAAAKGQQLVRLYRADDPAITVNDADSARALGVAVAAR